MINNSTKRVLHLTNNNKKTYKILTFPTHERYQTQLCKTGHEFFEFNLNGQKKWNKDQCPLPSNYYSLPENNVCSFIDYDFILSQSKFWQIQTALKLNELLKIPLISLEHTVPLNGFQSQEVLNNFKNMYGNVNIFISEYSQQAWGLPVDSHIIKHGIDTNAFKPLDFIEKKNNILTVANDFVKRDYCLNYTGWKNITQTFETKLIGDNPGLSISAPIEILIKAYNECAIYLNTSTLSPIPTSLLEAMSCGCAIVSTATCEIPNIITNGYNGYISNNENELKEYIQYLLDNEDKRKEIGQNARKTILEKYSEEQFIKNWNDVLDTAYEVFHT